MSIPPATPPQWEDFSKLLKKFKAMPNAEPFRVPVDYKSLGLMDYPKLIPKPMDLGTVEQKIQDKQYTLLAEACSDVRLVWTNCMTYNQDDSDFHRLARHLSDKWEKQFAALLRDLQLPPEAGKLSVSKKRNDATTEQKRRFVKYLYELSKDSMGQVLVTLDERSPHALVKNAEEDEVELNVDKIDSKVFEDLLSFVQEQAKKDKLKAKAKANSKKMKSESG